MNRLLRGSRFRHNLLARFAVLSLGPTVVLGLLLARDLEHSNRAEAVRDARTLAKLTARLRIQPLLARNDLGAPLPARRVARLTATLRSELARRDVARSKLWNRRGRVVYSDGPSIVGRTFGVSDELREALEGNVASEVTHLERREQAHDRRDGELVKVYVPLQFRAGQDPAGVFEIYVPYRPVAARMRWRDVEFRAPQAAGRQPVRARRVRRSQVGRFGPVRFPR